MGKKEAHVKELKFQLIGIKEKYLQAFKDKDYQLAKQLETQGYDVLEELRKAKKQLQND